MRGRGARGRLSATWWPALARVRALTRARRAARGRAPSPESAPALRRPARVSAARGSRSTRSRGFCALSLEILWFRLLDVAVKSHGLHLRHRARALPARPRPRAAWSARRLVARLRRPLAAFLALPVRAARERRRWRSRSSRGCRPRRPLYAWFFDYWGTSRSSTSARTGRCRQLAAALRACCRSRSSPCRRSSWGFRSRAAARGARRPAHERPQGRPAAGREHRRLHGGQPARRASLAARARSGPPGRFRLLMGAGGARVRCRRRARLRLARRFALRAALALVALAVALPGERRRSGSGCTATTRATPLAFSTRTRAAWARSLPGERRALAGLRQRQAPQLAALRRHPHAARRACPR